MKNPFALSSKGCPGLYQLVRKHSEIQAFFIFNVRSDQTASIRTVASESNRHCFVTDPFNSSKENSRDFYLPTKSNGE